MATNRKRAHGSPLRLGVSSPTKSNDPVLVGELGGVALTDWDSSDSAATVALEGVYALTVNGVDDAGNVAVNAGDSLYFTSGDTIKLSKKSSGVFYGYALESVTSGQNASIMVRLTPGGRSGQSGMFVSTEQTGNGTQQSIAHGLGVAPTKVLIALTAFSSGTNVSVVEGAHTSTNVLVTVTNGVKYKVWASK